MRRRLFALALLALWASPSMGDDASKNALRDQIQQTIQQRHPTDTPDWWRALGPEAPGVIITMYKATVDSLHRIHLLQGLGAFKDDTTAAAFLTEEAAATKKSPIRNAAVQSLASVQGEAALDELGDYLKHPDPRTRFATAQAVDRIGSTKSKEVLNDYLSNEKVSWIGARLRAEEPEPGLRPVAEPAAEAPLIDAWLGQWKGFWIEPGPGAKDELRSLAGELKWTSGGAAAIGELKLVDPKSKTPRVFQLQAAKPATKGRLSGQLVRAGVVGAKPAYYAFEGSLEREAGKDIQVIRIPEWGVRLVLGKK